MEFSFNKAFKESLMIPEKIRKQSEKCSKCQRQQKIYVPGGAWTYACHKECELYKKEEKD